MQPSPNEIKEKLLKALDKDNNVANMDAIFEVIAILERTPITKDELERTRLGKYVNELRKKIPNESLAKRAKDLVRKWRKMILPVEHGHGTFNGERTTVNIIGAGGGLSTSPAATHLPGPGPGPGHGGSWNLSISKTTSPNSIGNGRPLSSGGVRGKLSSPSIVTQHQQQQRVSSPGNWQCSSASTSPIMSVSGKQLNHNNSRPGTPNASKLRNFNNNNMYPYPSDGDKSSRGFKPVSPAPLSGNVVGGSGESRSSTPGLNAAATTKRSHHSPVLSFTGASAFGRSSASVSPEMRKLTQSPVSNHHHLKQQQMLKRPDSMSPRVQHPHAIDKDSSSSSPPVNFMNSAAMVNGIDMGDSMDSVPSPLDNVSSGGAATNASSQPFGNDSAGGGIPRSDSKKRKRNSRHSSRHNTTAEHNDVLKEKLASHLKTPRVKTTAELIEELKAKNSSTVSLIGDSLPLVGNGGSSSGAGVATLNSKRIPLPSPSSLRSSGKSSVPGADEDVARTKNELMEKFLKDTTSPASTPNRRTERFASIDFPHSSGIGINCGVPEEDPVLAILATLPPINVEDIDWGGTTAEDLQDKEQQDEEEEKEKKPERSITEEDVQRLHDDNWDWVNGNFDYDSQFSRWNEVLKKQTFNGEILHILPYVDID